MFDHATLPPPPRLPDLSRERPVALFLDFDGTLVELAPTPDSISVGATLADDLATLGARLDGRLALVSGRAIPDLQRHLGPLRVARAGSHGIARELADGSLLGDMPAPLPDDATAALREFAAAHGFALEQKPHGAALHYRSDPSLEPAGLAFAQDLAGRHQLEVKRGKSVIELVRPGVSKEGAVRAFMQVAPFAGAVPIFVGDDITDEDGFRAAEALGGFGILVGERTPTRARYRLPDTTTVHDWLGL